METRTMGKTLRLVLVAATALAAGAATLAPPARAQDLPEPGEGYTWERVGDRGIDVEDLTFGPDSTLWATGDDGPFRLDTTDGFPGVWMLLQDFPAVGSLVVLGRGPEGDTLITGRSVTRRSVDGGVTWEQVHDRGGGGLYEVPAGYPYAGRILTGAPSAIAYSDDRGASFTPSVVPDDGQGNRGGANDFVALPPGSSHAGRILAAGLWGASFSDDGGETFRASGLWQVLLYIGEHVDAVEAPEGGAVLGGEVNAQPLARAWSSTDDGETWLPDGGQPLLEGPPNGAWGVKGVLALGGGSVLVVLHVGTVYRTDDAGQTWAAVGRAPEVSASPATFVASAALGPDRRLYVGLAVAGSGQGWVWRTAETHDPAPVSSEPEPEESSLGVEAVPNPSRGAATVALTVPEPGEVAVGLYDVLGRRVAVLHEGPLGAGRHELAVEAGALPPGVYVVRVAAGREVAARTVTVLR